MNSNQPSFIIEALQFLKLDLNATNINLLTEFCNNHINYHYIVIVDSFKKEYPRLLAEHNFNNKFDEFINS